MNDGNRHKYSGEGIAINMEMQSKPGCYHIFSSMNSHIYHPDHRGENIQNLGRQKDPYMAILYCLVVGFHPSEK